ncbi:MAG: sensor domain-containing protein [Streptosporangiaceae bacterium]|nr:sensor domain-containing protein [Streptosporangiaceae bacterium]
MPATGAGRARRTGKNEDMTTIRRAGRDLVYTALGSLAGLFGAFVVGFTIVPGVALSVTVIFTVVGLLIVIVALRLAARIGSLHRRILDRMLRETVPPPAPFEPGTGILGRLDRRLRYRPAWRAVWFSVIKLPVAVVQGYTISAVVCGLIDMTYPEVWLLFRNHAAGTRLSPLSVQAPVPVLDFRVSTWPGTFPAALVGIGWLLAGVWVARGAIALDRRLIRSLLGPATLSERVSELERTRTLAVEDSAAALRRVERDLHDGAQMRLAALAMNLGMAREKLGDDDEPAGGPAASGAPSDLRTIRELVDAAHRNAVDALADLRDIARGIHPPALDNGLAVALESLAASSAIPVTLSVVPAGGGTTERPAPAIETIAYFCAAELIANATKHSYADIIEIEINYERSGLLRLRISDDGVGGADQARGSGLAGLAQRVSTVDGRLDVSSPPGGPTVVLVELPLRA